MSEQARTPGVSPAQNMTNPYVEPQGFWRETWWIFLEYLRFGFLAMFVSAAWLAWTYVLTGDLPSGEPGWPKLACIFGLTLLLNKGTPWWKRSRLRQSESAPRKEA